MIELTLLVIIILYSQACVFFLFYSILCMFLSTSCNASPAPSFEVLLIYLAGQDTAMIELTLLVIISLYSQACVVS